MGGVNPVNSLTQVNSPLQNNDSQTDSSQEQELAFLQQSLSSIPDKELEYGSFHCAKYRSGKKCEVCSHMVERSHVYSIFFKQKFRIHGHLSHDFSPADRKRWYIYLIEDIPCMKAIIGSTVDPYKRWSTHKSSCNNGPCKGTGLSKHFTFGVGCPNDPGRKKETLVFTLVDFIEVTADELLKAGHEKGPKCRCICCTRLIWRTIGY